MDERDEQDTTRPAPRRPRHGRRIAAAGVALAVAAAGIWWAVGRDDEGSGIRVATARPPAPRFITRGGDRFQVQEATPTAVTVSADDARTLEVHLRRVYVEGSPECASLRPSARLVEETRTSIRIAAFDYEVPRARDGVVSCAFFGSSSDPVAWPVRLQRSWAGRRIVDDRTGKTLGMLPPGAALTVSSVPAGFTPTMVETWSPDSDFITLRQYDRDGLGLEVRVRTAPEWTTLGDVLGRGTVNGATAKVTDEDYQRCATWVPRSGLIAEVCSLPAEEGGDGHLSPEELLRIARGVSVPPAG